MFSLFCSVTELKMEIDLEEAKRLHELGVPWAEVAKRLGTSFQTLKDRRKRAEHPVFCRYCGKIIEGRRRLYCDAECRFHYLGWKTHFSKARTFFCKLCGRKVETKPGDRRLKYCCERCAFLAWRLRVGKNKELIMRHVEKYLEEIENEH